MQLFQEQINHSSEDILLKKTQEQRVELVLGNPKCGCKGTGICKVELMAGSPTVASRSTCRSVEARACLKSTGSMLITVERQKLTACSRRHFASNRFLVPHAVSISGELAAVWEVPVLQVQPGLYCVEVTSELISFELKLMLNKH